MRALCLASLALLSACTSPADLCKAVVAQDMVERLALITQIEEDLERGYARRSRTVYHPYEGSCGSNGIDCVRVDSETQTTLMPIERAQLIKQRDRLRADALAAKPALDRAFAACERDHLAHGRL